MKVIDTLEYWRSGRGMKHITPTGVEWPEAEGFREMISELFFLQKTIEFGCGRGRLAPCFDPALYTGIDICSAAIEEAKVLNPGYRFRHDYVLPAIDGYDALLAHTVLLHVPDDQLHHTISRFAVKRVIVSEILGREWRRPDGDPPAFNRGLNDYFDAFRAIGYRLHRVMFHPYPHYEGTDLSIMEFHLDH